MEISNRMVIKMFRTHPEFNEKYSAKSSKIEFKKNHILRLVWIFYLFLYCKNMQIIKNMCSIFMYIEKFNFYVQNYFG